MKVNIGLIDEFRIVVTDITRNSISGLPSKIYNIRLDIINKDLVGGIIRDLDVLTYMFVNQKDGEMFIIDSNTLGKGKGNRIADGSYTFVLRVNGTVEYEGSVLILTAVKEKLLELAKELPVDIASTDEYIRHTKLTDDMLHFYYASSLYVKLVGLTYSLYNSVETDNMIYKLSRVLSIINIKNFRI
jgi:hypothetical protein